MHSRGKMSKFGNLKMHESIHKVVIATYATVLNYGRKSVNNMG
jgi:hypothetical protein